MSGAALNTVEDLNARLRELHPLTAQTPLYNPVFQLGLELSRKLENGEMSLDDIERLVAEMECEGLRARAARLDRLLKPVPVTQNDVRIDSIANEEDFSEFAARWQRPAAHVVFTAHPTFLLTSAQTESVAQSASNGDFSEAAVCSASPQRDTITLDYEHDRAMAALARGQKARDRISARLFDIAATRWPKRWKSLQPMPVRFATWVGYDMDGRTDISWSTSIRYRLEEKAMRLAAYAQDLMSTEPAIAERLERAGKLAADMAARFAEDLSQPEALSAAANALTAEHPDKLVSLEGVIAELEEEARHADQDVARQLLVVAAAMRSDGLGMGWIHFRVNSSQLQNAIRRRIDPDGKLSLASQAALVRMRELLAEVKPLRSNFAALAIENSTAVRQFLAMAQILQHIDSDTPIRMLVAECEQPTTVLAALYFARMFGIDDKVDVSPLFETESALEHGGRFLDAVLSEPAYREYARKRGRVSIQTGFSDAGRFVGQIPAALAIERLQGRLAEAMAANAMTDVAALIFNTGGESMGRGAHPSSIEDRFDWQMSPWARRRFLRAGIRLEPEVSFQGGDGYLWFGSDELALATLTRMAERPLWGADTNSPTDVFYRRTDLSLDFYRAIRGVQHEHLESHTYSRAITAFGLGLLNDTGSRKSRRQSDLSGDRTMSLRQIRAIPHNAILQQLGYPVNVIAGIGTAADGNIEEIASLLIESERGRQLIRLARAANALGSIKTVAAYGELFNSAYWASRPYRGDEQHISDACLKIGEYLTKDDRTGVFRRLASRLRVDAMKLHRLLDQIPDESPLPDREHTRRSLGVLQSLRIALFKHMFLRAVMVPAFSRANDISREDVLEMFFSLRVDDGLSQLRRAFPISFPSINDFSVDLPSDYPDSSASGYSQIHRDYIDPIARSYALSLRITTAIANEFGAHG
ncbi:phosphoenolpyruvate carboxylase [Novosphingobium pentaromativorans]|uniref:Phosphoenolpyruvate carboxylase n=1 Tax=Novosphingobium pentaromativorans US6-1 TaxID=1088721 RepID=G6EA32_9SPHN|nr:phosphoenolpyruvate carboxylase [Novosphingobium pentaromativorans]AIT80825.1 phosphoenolpyruvate carboxylase [Novosphingobium pentaromativorans US6-1]EHJ61889.1 phosphoenolpyruvate carboxylase [Novosphingobium pentaromativorans US6-1]